MVHVFLHAQFMPVEAEAERGCIAGEFQRAEITGVALINRWKDDQFTV
jgi:hypothetical protein